MKRDATKKTRIPSHIIRRAAFERLAAGSGIAFDVWIEQKWHTFMRKFGSRVRKNMLNAEFDYYLEHLPE